MTKIIYRILSLHTGTPVYRLYNYEQAQDIFLAVQKQWPEHSFWLEKKERQIDIEC